MINKITGTCKVISVFIKPSTSDGTYLEKVIPLNHRIIKWLGLEAASEPTQPKAGLPRAGSSCPFNLALNASADGAFFHDCGERNSG